MSRVQTLQDLREQEALARQPQSPPAARPSLGEAIAAKAAHQTFGGMARKAGNAVATLLGLDPEIGEMVTDLGYEVVRGAVAWQAQDYMNQATDVFSFLGTKDPVAQLAEASQAEQVVAAVKEEIKQDQEQPTTIPAVQPSSTSAPSAWNRSELSLVTPGEMSDETTFHLQWVKQKFQAVIKPLQTILTREQKAYDESRFLPVRVALSFTDKEDNFPFGKSIAQLEHAQFALQHPEHVPARVPVTEYFAIIKRVESDVRKILDSISVGDKQQLIHLLDELKAIQTSPSMLYLKTDLTRGEYDPLTDIDQIRSDEKCMAMLKASIEHGGVSPKQVDDIMVGKATAFKLRTRDPATGETKEIFDSSEAGRCTQLTMTLLQSGCFQEAARTMGASLGHKPLSDPSTVLPKYTWCSWNGQWRNVSHLLFADVYHRILEPDQPMNDFVATLLTGAELPELPPRQPIGGGLHTDDELIGGEEEDVHEQAQEYEDIPADQDVVKTKHARLQSSKQAPAAVPTTALSRSVRNPGYKVNSVAQKANVSSSSPNVTHAGLNNTKLPDSVMNPNYMANFTLAAQNARVFNNVSPSNITQAVIDHGLRKALPMDEMVKNLSATTGGAVTAAAIVNQYNKNVTQAEIDAHAMWNMVTSYSGDDMTNNIANTAGMLITWLVLRQVQNKMITLLSPAVKGKAKRPQTTTKQDTTYFMRMLSHWIMPVIVSSVLIMLVTGCGQIGVHSYLAMLMHFLSPNSQSAVGDTVKEIWRGALFAGGAVSVLAAAAALRRGAAKPETDSERGRGDIYVSFLGGSQHIGSNDNRKQHSTTDNRQHSTTHNSSYPIGEYSSEDEEEEQQESAPRRLRDSPKSQGPPALMPSSEERAAIRSTPTGRTTMETKKPQLTAKNSVWAKIKAYATGQPLEVEVETTHDVEPNVKKDDTAILLTLLGML
jgi:cell division protein FtsB